LPPSAASVKAVEQSAARGVDLPLQARLVTEDLPPSSDGPTKAERKAQEQRS